LAKSNDRRTVVVGVSICNDSKTGTFVGILIAIARPVVEKMADYP
jgi:hypothetical protein